MTPNDSGMTTRVSAAERAWRARDRRATETRRRPIPARTHALALALLLVHGVARAAPELFVCDSSMDRVVRLQDIDGSGAFEPDVAGEVVVFYDDASPGPDLSTPSALALGPDGRLLLLDGGTLDAILALRDGDDDGDANDEGEVEVFYDDSSDGPDLGTPNAMALAQDGWLVLVDDGGSRGLILALRDGNGDGDALDEGEWRVLYDSTIAGEGDGATGTVLTDPEALAIDARGRLLVTDATLGIIAVLDDGNDDGDVMDEGEVSVFHDPTGAHPFTDPEGLAIGRDGEVYAADEDTGIIVRLIDRDGDGLIGGPTEVTLFTDAEDPSSPRDVNDIALGDDGALIVLDGARDQIWRALDADGDGTARSAGEVMPLIGPGERVVGTPSGVAVAGGSPGVSGREFRRGDVNGDDTINLTDAIVILEYLFLGVNAPACLDSADVDDDGAVSISDPIALLGHLFLGDAPPPPPFSEPGGDPTDDDLPCDAS